MEKRQFSSLNEFYTFYLQEHKNKTNRRLHFTGTSLFLVLVVVMLATQNWQLFFLLPVAGYGFAWTGHFFIEKNRPATFTYPFYSFVSDFRMYYDILRGRL